MDKECKKILDKLSSQNVDITDGQIKFARMIKGCIDREEKIYNEISIRRP